MMEFGLKSKIDNKLNLYINNLEDALISINLISSQNVFNNNKLGESF